MSGNYPVDDGPTPLGKGLVLALLAGASAGLMAALIGLGGWAALGWAWDRLTG